MRTSVYPGIFSKLFLENLNDKKDDNILVRNINMKKSIIIRQKFQPNLKLIKGSSTNKEELLLRASYHKCTFSD